MKRGTETHAALQPRHQNGSPGFVRYILSGLLFVNCVLLYAMRLNLSVSITAMVNSTSSVVPPSVNDSCISPHATNDNSTVTETTSTPFFLRYEKLGSDQGEFNWDQKQQAMITYAFFVGYVITQVPGGYLAERYSVKWVLGLGMGLTSLLTCSTSVVARASFHGLLALRALEGLSEGVVFPCLFVFVSNWVPVQEQGFLLSFIVAGCTVGTVVTMPVTAMLCDSAWQWPASFYVFGILGLLVSLLWLTLGADYPEYHRWISFEERDYIVKNRPATSRNQSSSVPWRSLLLSPAVLVLGIMRLGGTINLYIILTEFPSYLKYMFGINTVDNGFINGGITLGCSISVVFCGWAADKILARKLTSKNALRKFCVAVSCLVPASCMAIIPQLGCNYGMVLAFVLINCVSMGFSGGGDGLIPLDIAPEYAGTVQGVVNCISNAAGVVGPEFVGYMTENNNTIQRWNLVFYCVAVSAAVGGIVFLVFGSVAEQEWAKARDVVQQKRPSLEVNVEDLLVLQQ